MTKSYYQSTDGAMPTYYDQRSSRQSPLVIWGIAAIVACLVALVTYEVTSQAAVSHFISSIIPRVATRSTAMSASRRESVLPNFSFGKKEEPEEEPAKPSFFGGGSKSSTKKSAAPKVAAEPNEALENVGRITGVGAKVVSELALYLAFNTAYFVTNSYQFLTKEEQKKLAKETVDKQLPELLSLLGGTTETLSRTASTVAETAEYKDLQKSAANAAEELTKGLKTENTPAPEVIEKLKKIVADEKGEVLSEERKQAVGETLKKGGIKAAELSLYVFYNTFSLLRNLDKVLPTNEQTGGIEGKIEELETKVVELAEQVKELPSQTGKISEKVEEIKRSIPTAEDLANLDAATVSLSVRSSLAKAKDALGNAVAAVDRSLQKDSEFRKTLTDISLKLKPVTDALAALVAKLPLPKKADGSIDYSRLLAESGIITIKGIKALVEATKNAAASVKSKTNA